MGSPPVFVTGATGYIGGRLVPRLLAAGYRVRCLARSPAKLADRAWAADPRLEIVEGELMDPALDKTMAGCGASFYLVHSMLSAGRSYARRDSELAAAFARAAAHAGLARIVYLGGLGEMGAGLSEHLASRREVERVLASTGVPVTVFRAAMIIGSGSASFEILRYLVERLPVMVTPRWVNTECQPIGVDDVLGYLVNCLRVPQTAGETFDIGGAEVVTYRSLMQTMAEERGLPARVIIPVPVLTPRLSAMWIHLVTPLSRRIAAPLAEGLRNRVVCRDDRAQQLMPQRLLGAREAIRSALDHVDRHDVATTWSAAGVIPGDPDWAGGATFVDRRSVEVTASPDDVYRAVSRIGGDVGYYGADRLWRLRGVLDRLAGGPGLRRGRRDPDSLWFGEAVDFWRVVDTQTGRRLVLRAEMKLPGVAQLEFQIEPIEPLLEQTATGPSSRTLLVQTARFLPRGLLGLAYWYAVLPLHGIVFRRMISGIARVAEQAAASRNGRAGDGT